MPGELWSHWVEYYTPTPQDEVIRRMRLAAAMGKPLIDMDHGNHVLGDQMDVHQHRHEKESCEPMGMRHISSTELLRKQAAQLHEKGTALTKLADELEVRGFSPASDRVLVDLIAQSHGRL